MSISVLEAVLAETRKLAHSAFYTKFSAAAPQFLTSSKKKISGSEIFREQLNTSIHSISLKDIITFIIEYNNTYNKQLSNKEISLMSRDYFSEINNISNKYFKYKHTIYFLIDNKLTTTVKTAIIELSIGKRSSLPSAFKSIVDSAKPSIDIFNTAKSIFSKAAEQLLAKDSTRNSLKEYINSGIDVGHVTSNITYFTNIAVVSGLKQSVGNDSTQVAKLYDSIKNTEIKDIIRNYYLKEINSSTIQDATKEAIFEYIFDSQIDLLRTFSSDGKLKGTVSLKFKEGNIGKDLFKSIKQITDKALVKIAPQSSKINQDIGRLVESQVRTHLPVFYGAILEAARSQLGSIDISELKGSKSLRQLAEDSIVSTILTGKNKEKQKTNTVGKLKEPVKQKKIQVNKSSSLNNSKKVIVNSAIKTQKLRSTSGAFQSVSNLEALIRMSLYETIKRNMHSPNLNFQTGRFAESVELKSMSYDNRTGAVTAFLTYMKYPYATFEPGGDRGSIDKSPSSLIIRSVREIATKLTKARMQAIII